MSVQMFCDVIVSACVCVCGTVTIPFYRLCLICSLPRKQLQIKTKRRNKTKLAKRACIHTCCVWCMCSMNSFYTPMAPIQLLLFTGYYSYFTCYTLISCTCCCCCCCCYFVFFYLHVCSFPSISFQFDASQSIQSILYFVLAFVVAFWKCIYLTINSS